VKLDSGLGNGKILKVVSNLSLYPVSLPLLSCFSTLCLRAPYWTPYSFSFLNSGDSTQEIVYYLLCLPRHVELVDAALDLWAVAFNTLTHARRKNIMRVTNPTLLIMLNNRKHIKPKDTSQLFGDKFAKAVQLLTTWSINSRELRPAMRQK
jgi:hypothetical protein